MTQRILLSIVVLVAVFGMVQGEQCCNWPIFWSVNSANITFSKFKCREPISYLCELTNQIGTSKINKVGIAGIIEYPSNFAVVSSAKYEITAEILCGAPDSNKWHVDAVNFEFPQFGCAYFVNGTWTLDYSY